MQPTVESIKSAIIESLKTIYDPEIPVNIYDLGLIYDIEVNSELEVSILMTLTSPNCPVSESLPIDIKEKILLIQGVAKVEVKITFEPTWSMEMLSEEAKLELGFL